MADVAKRLSGSGGAGGIDAVSLGDWLLRYGQGSSRLRDSLAKLAEWLSNHSPPWAAYRALVTVRIIALDKCPGVSPVGIGETVFRLLAKCVLLVAGEEATASCGVHQLCGGLEAGIEGGIHAMCCQWGEVKDEESPWGALLVDAKNAFNEVHRTSLMWHVRHRWPSGSTFAFNAYRHSRVLVLRGFDGVLLSREGVTQGDPLAMVLYAIALLPIISKLEQWLTEEDALKKGLAEAVLDNSDNEGELSDPTPLEHQPSPTPTPTPTPPITPPLKWMKPNQFWYADDSSLVAQWRVIKGWFRLLQTEGPKIGYHPEPDKSILIVSPEHVAWAKEFFKEEQFKIRSGARYLGGFIGTEEESRQHVMDKVKDWEAAVGELTKVAWKEPQAAFSGFTRSLQSEWTFIQRVLPDMDSCFLPLAESIRDSLIPALFGYQSLPIWVKSITSLPIRWSGMGLRSPEAWASDAFLTSLKCTTHLTHSLLFNRDKFSLSDHKSAMMEGKLERKRRVEESCEKARDEVIKVNELSKGKERALNRGRSNGQWLAAIPRRRDGTDLSASVFRDGLSIRYQHVPLHLPPQCDGCGQRSSLDHALNCHTGGQSSFGIMKSGML